MELGLCVIGVNAGRGMESDWSDYSCSLSMCGK